MINYYTLLFINPEESSLGNGVKGDYNEKIEKYIRCCLTLSESLRVKGLQGLTIITNDSKKIISVANNNFIQSSKVHCVEIPFKTKVPSNIAFSSAHHKLDVFKYFSTLPQSEYSVLLDSDVLCINDEPFVLKKLGEKVKGKSNVAQEFPAFIYNISDQQIQAFTAERVCHDKDLLITKAFNEKAFASSALWAGGEYISGSASFYKTLYSACLKLLPTYFENAKTLFHNGDEMIVSCAIEYLLQKKKIAVFDAGLFGIVGRYYDSSTNHVQHIWKYFSKNFLVHLPMDKDFLASYKVSGDVLPDLEKYLQANKTFINATVRSDKQLQSLTKSYYSVRRFIKKITGHGNAPVEY